MSHKLIAVPAAALLLTLPALHARQAEITRHPLHSRVTYPEGIAYDPKDGNVYTASAETGLVFRMEATVPAAKFGTIVSPEHLVLKVDAFPGILGMKVDDAGRLWLAGGRTGRMAVVSTSDGKVLKRLETPAQPGGLINDVAVVGSAAYFTDTLRPTLWRVMVKGNQIGDAEPWLDFKGSPIEYGQGANLNGIAATPDGRHLIVVHMSRGLLFRIGIADKQITPIETGGEALATADGLVLDGRTLYVVRQGEQEVATVALSEDLTKGRVVNRFKDPALLWPATAAKVGDRLLVVNTQFNKRGTKDPVLPFSIIGIPLSMLAGK